MLKSLTHKLDNLFYPDTSRIWDDIRFVQRLKENLESDFVILDLGAGRGKSEIPDLRNHAKRIAGADVDQDVLKNPYLHDKYIITPGQRLDIPENTFDLIYSCNVLEHIAEPRQLLAEISRLLKPGGLFMAKTSNKNHYIALAARMTPLWFHKSYNRKRGRDTVDTFPTVYKCNSKRQLEKAIGDSGLNIDFLEFWEWRPEYLRISPVTYVFGIAYEKLVNCSQWFKPFRAVMMVGLRNPA